MKTTEIIILWVLFAVCSFGSLALGIYHGKYEANNQTREKLKSCIHAPTPITIGDTLYLIRVYPLDLNNIPKTNQ